MTINNQLVIEKVDNGFIIAIQEKIQVKSLFLGSSTTQTDKKYLVAKDIKEVKDLLTSHLKDLITASESLKLLEEAETEDEDNEDEDDE
jgi:ketopantoate hydroxymethyltransferase